jgi:HAD superfamily hydrolase (TIGR01509 family)
MPLKLVIFDCDGVILDSRLSNREYYNMLLAAFGHGPMSKAELDFVHCHNVMDSVAFLFGRYPEDDLKAVHDYRKSVDYTPFLEYLTLEPDLKEFLHFLRPRHGTAISTNRTTTMPDILARFGLTHLFDLVVTATDVANPKPHPEALLKILDHFGVTAAEAIFIGDSIVDRQHADTVGMRLIAYKNPDLAAEFHVDRFMAIPSLPLFEP